MNSIFKLFLLLNINQIIQETKCDNINCNKDGYKLKNTIAFGIIDGYYYQLTTNLKFVKYKLNDGNFIDLKNGDAGLIDDWYPNFGKNQKYYAYVKLKQANLFTDVSFSNEVMDNNNYFVFRIINRSDKIVYILKDSYLNDSSELKTFENNFNGEIEKMVPIWTNAKFLMNIVLVNNLTAKQTFVYNSFDKQSNLLGVLCSESMDHNNSPKLISVKEIYDKCHSFSKFIRDISFAFVKGNLIYLVSMKMNMAFNFRIDIFTKINEPHIIKSIEIKDLFNCEIDEQFIHDSTLSSKSILGNIIIISLTLFIIIPILVMIGLYLYYGIYRKKMLIKLKFINLKRKDKKQKNENLKYKFSIKKAITESTTTNETNKMPIN